MVSDTQAGLAVLGVSLLSAIGLAAYFKKLPFQKKEVSPTTEGVFAFDEFGDQYRMSAAVAESRADELGYTIPGINAPLSTPDDTISFQAPEGTIPVFVETYPSLSLVIPEIQFIPDTINLSAPDLEDPVLGLVDYRVPSGGGYMWETGYNPPAGAIDIRPSQSLSVQDQTALFPTVYSPEYGDITFQQALERENLTSIYQSLSGISLGAYL